MRAVKQAHYELRVELSLLQRTQVVGLVHREGEKRTVFSGQMDAALTPAVR
jgi:hypothetical protein